MEPDLLGIERLVENVAIERIALRRVVDVMVFAQRENSQSPRLPLIASSVVSRVSAALEPPRVAERPRRRNGSLLTKA